MCPCLEVTPIPNQTTKQRKACNHITRVLTIV